MQLSNDGTRNVIRFRDQQVKAGPRSVSVYKLPIWVVKAIEGLLHTLPRVTTVRLTFMDGDDVIGELNCNLTGNQSSDVAVPTPNNQAAV